MKINTRICQKIDAFLDVLEREVQQLNENLSLLDQLRACVIKQQEQPLVQLLEEIKIKSQQYPSHQQHRDHVRQDLADTLGWELSNVTLTRLEGLCESDRKKNAMKLKTELTALTQQFKAQYAATAALLEDCATFNRRLLQNIFQDRTASTVTYGPAGLVSRHVQRDLMSIKY